jgi:RNA polymerase sigma factor (sigma-70 family)
MDESLDAWFKREIFVHEEALVRFLRRNWKNAGDILDLRQETYTRVYEAALKSRPTVARSFLFSTARNLMADRIRHQRVITIDTVGDLDTLSVLIDEISPERQHAARQELRVLARAFDSLPPKCRETVWLRRVERLPQREVAARMKIAPKTVEWHLTTGLKRLADALFGDDMNGPGQPPASNHSSERMHGKQ